MANPYIGQISVFAFPFAPVQWAYCAGSNMPINQFGTLFALIGTTFGGNGTTQFGLPNLGGVSLCGTGSGPGLTPRYVGQQFGSSTVTLDMTTMPAHTHTAQEGAFTRGATRSSTPTPTSALTTATDNIYNTGGANITMSGNGISPNGSGTAHNNMQPYLAMNYCMALAGQYPYFE